MARGLSRLAACATLGLAALFSTFTSPALAQGLRAPAPGNEPGAIGGPGSIGGDPTGVPVERPRVLAQSMLGRVTAANEVRGSVVFRNAGARRTYVAITPAGEELHQATALGLASGVGRPVELVGINVLLVGFSQPTTVDQARAFFAQQGLVGEVTQMTRLRDVFKIRTASALQAFQAGDALGNNPAIRFSHPDLYAEIVTTVPVLQLRQGATTINSGDPVDFGTTTQGTAVTIDFQITNTGDQPLSIDVGAVPTGFSLVTPFPATPIAPDGTFDFTLSMTATNVGMPSGDFEILNNSATNPFIVSLMGTVNAPVGPATLRVTLNNSALANGASVNFGSTTEGTPVVRTFTIHNDGADALTVGTVNVPAGYTVTAQPVSPVNGGQSTAFSVQLDAAAAGTFTGMLSFLNNDADDNPFELSLTGSVTGEGGGDDIEDPLFEDQWHLTNSGQGGGTPLIDINVEEGWLRTLGSGAIVAIMDDGTQPEHPDYAGNIVPCVDCVNEFDFDFNVATGDGNHGTAVAGLVAAAANTIGVRGGAPEAGIVLTSFYGSVSENADNWAAAAEAGASVHTNSWGFGNPTFLPDIQRDTIIDLTNSARDGKGMLFLFATANSYTLTLYGSALASMEETLGVGGVNNLGQRAAFANFGLGTDVVGPTNFGTLGITTTDVTGEGGYNDMSDYTRTFGGTSAATPIVAGLAALVMAENPELHAAQLKRIIMHTANQNSSRNDLLELENLGFNSATSFNESFGYGLPNAATAIQAARDAITNGGFTWPAPASDVEVSQSLASTTVTWTNPPAGAKGEFAGAMLVRMGTPGWKPTDGVTYAVGDMPTSEVTVVATGNIDMAVDPVVTIDGNALYGVFIFNSQMRYSFGVLGRAVSRGGTTFRNFDFEADAGWTGTGEWERGVPNVDTVFIDVLDFNGDLLEIAFATPPRTRGFNTARSGSNVFATDLDGTYDPDTVHELFSPVIDLTGTTASSASFTFWEMLELETNNPGTFIRIDVVGPEGSNPTVLRSLRRTTNPGNLYQWTPAHFDLSPEIGQEFRIRFQLSADVALTGRISQFQGWFIDDVRFETDGAIVNPPIGSRRPGIIRLPPPGGFVIGLSAPAVPISASPDVNSDGKFDMLDVSDVLRSFGARSGNALYERRLDMDDDGEISAFDLVVVFAAASDPSLYTEIDESPVGRRGR